MDNLDKHVNVFRNFMVDEIFPDTCTFTPQGTPTLDAGGIPTEGAVTPRTYEGSEDIPCIFYPSRAFENEELDLHPTVANRYYLEVPQDFTFEHSDYVTVNGRRFEIRKVSGVSDFDITNELIITEVMSDYDKI